MQSEKSNKSQFRLSPALNKSRVFILQKSEIEKRLDPLYYASNIFGFLKTTNYKIKTIREVAEYTISGFGVGREEQDLTENGFIQIRPTNLDVFGNLKFGRNVYLGNEFLECKKYNIVQKGEILFNNTNSQELVGKTAYFDLDGTYFHSNHITRIRVDEKVIRPKFLWLLLNLYQKRKIFYTLCTNWNNQSGVGIDLLNSIKLVIPNFDIQDKVIAIHQKAYEQKKTNEAEAEKLLSSIDHYLLKELGIKLPEPAENTLKNRMFVTKINSVSGNRFDPFFHQAYFIEVENAIKSSNFRTDILRNQLSFIESGSRPKGGATKDDEGILSLGGEHVNNYCEVQVRTAKYIPLEFHQSILSTETKLNDILFVKDGATTGKVGMINKPDYAGQNINEHVFLLRPIPEINPFYLVNYLNSKAAQIVIKKLIAGATVTGITKDALKSLPIPVPPLDKQKEIAEHITEIRQQAQQIKDNTTELLKKASEEIQEILLQ